MSKGRFTRILAAEINDVLWEAWDPIGINDAPDAPRDEYSGYALRIAGLLINGVTVDVVAAELDSIAETAFGIRGDGSLLVAEKCFAAYSRHAVDPD